ncbi:ribonuclease R [Deinococcus hohokamensis]|uniref:Ribonuclease R n=1 Tax=Deinococcus hohokamensis TaxID=309883 RepID=A0ABV9IAJ2_9DEIO
MPRVKKSGAVPVEADATPTEPSEPTRGQRRQAKAAAPQTEDTVTTRKTPSKRAKPAPATEEATPKPARRPRRASAPVDETQVAAQVTAPDQALAEAPTSATQVSGEQVPSEQPAPRRGRRAQTKMSPEPAGTSEEATAPVEAAAQTPGEPAQPPILVPTRRGRGRRSGVEVAPEASPSVTASEDVASPTVSEPAEPAAKGRRGRRTLTATAQVTAEEPAAPAQPDTAPEEAPAPAKRQRRGTRTPAPALADAEPVEAPQGDPEPVLLERPKRRGRRPKTAEPVLPVLDGVEPLSASSEPAPAAPATLVTSTDDLQDPVTDLVQPEQGSDAPAASAQGAATPSPATLPEVPTRGRRPRKAPRAEPVPAEPEPAQADADEAAEPAAQDAASDDETSLLDADPARDLVVAQLRKLGRPVHVRDLERTFTRQMINRLGDWRDLEALLETLVDSGAVIRTRRRTYGLPEAMSLVRGKFQASAAGFGFVVPDSGGEDYYIPAEQTMEAWNGDIVLVRMEGRGDTRDGRGPRRGQRGDGNPRAAVVRIVQRAYTQLVGTLEFHHGHPILKPDDHRARHRILVLPEGLEGLEAGARVVTELFWPEHTGEDEVFGQIKRVLGAEDDPETETEAVIVKFGLRGEFPAEVIAQAEAIPSEIPEEALVGRLDLREFNIFTVDGRDAKDFDDAIHIQPTPEGTFVVGIHIADVSHYVREGTPLDDEAYARATSVYLPGRVLPMLPEHLSNGVCSLVPYQDRLTLTAMVELSAEGDILDVKLAPSVINSKARLTYDEVQAYSEATATLPDHARHLEGDLHLLLKITSKLRQKRLREGSLDFKMREVKVDVGPDGRMELIPIREETARGMIEDLMLLANKVVAHELLQREIPALFRIHEEPTLQRFQEVTNAIGRLGFSFPGGEPTPQAYQAVLKQVRGTPRESVVNTLLLRSMQQAKYAGENLGHFGLAFDEYLHFTSPIRRYPDLLVHRVLRGMLSSELKAGNREVARLQGRLPAMGEHTSDRERTAAEAERDLTKYYQAKWAQEHLHETFAGNVSGVVASGLYVALDNGVEGKLHISNLDDDYYVYIEDAQMLRGRSNGRSYRLGDPVTVTISAVNPLARMVDLTLGDLQENAMNEVKPRARRREDREAERREKLQSVTPSAPRKFTLDEPQAVQASPRPGRTSTGRGFERDRSSGGPRGGQGGGFGAQGGRGQSQGGGPRRVITLERPRNEHLRPVNITVQRMYFGDWTLDNMPPEEPQGGGRPGRFERHERAGGDRGRGFTRGGNDRGAVGRVNGAARPGAQAQPARPAQSAPQATDAQSEEAKRRRRRRGRRGTSGGAGQD